jgi:alkylation response protein AidB-like acyl-CoA dehydrogenase
MADTMAEVGRAVDEIAEQWRSARAERQARRRLDRADFDALRDAGLLRLIAPVEVGGLWRSAEADFREICSIYRRLGATDPSVALVSAMHPAVVVFWLASPDPTQAAWEEQRRAVFESAAAGVQWGTITSEPGSGGDIGRTRAVARALEPELAPFLVGPTYAVTGDKHFGSGLGVTDRMITTAIPEGETDPTIFVLDVRDRPWDGSAGLELVAEWDGMGMAATQSHAMRLEAAPAVRLAWGGRFDAITRAAGPYIASLFTAVVLGVLDEAIAVARDQVRRKANQLRAYERVEWARSEQDHWVATQAHDGALRSIEGGRPTVAHDALRAKQAVAELAEQTLLRLTRILGGGTFSRRSPFAHWFEDVRALGFLRPPWGLASDSLFTMSTEQSFEGLRRPRRS